MAVFERPPSSRDVGYVLKERNGFRRERERKGRPVIRETRQVREGGRRNDDTDPRFLFRNRRTHIL